MRDMELQKELDALKNKSFAKKTNAQLRAIENLCGRNLSKEHRKKIGKSNKNKIVSAETRKKISYNSKNRSLETLAKIGNAQKGKIVSKETRKKISKAQLGKTVSSETRRKLASNCHTAKLSFIIANKIRKEYNSRIKKFGVWGAKTYIAKKYNVANKTIKSIIDNKIWKE